MHPKWSTRKSHGQAAQDVQSPPGSHEISDQLAQGVQEGQLAWFDEYRLEILSLKMSQQHRKADGKPAASSAHFYRDARDAAQGDIVYSLTSELKAAKPGPPCRAFNNGSCQYSADHVTNGYTQLHVYAHCLSAKCLFWPHADKGCKTKMFFKKRQGVWEVEPGVLPILFQTDPTPAALPIATVSPSEHALSPTPCHLADDLSRCIVALGPSCFVWKADLERAYRQLRSQPLDYPLMGIKHRNNVYIDVCPSFGARGSECDGIFSGYARSIFQCA